VDSLEKKTIINEVFEETFERLDDSVDMKIETLSPKDKFPVNCPKCHIPIIKIYYRYDDTGIDYDDNAFDLKVVKCPDCKKVYAYWIDNSYKSDRFKDDSENIEPTGNQPLDNKRNRAIPRKCAQKYLKAIAIQDVKNRELNSLIEAKIMDLYKIGLSLTTINLARNEVYRYILPNTTSKRINIMFAAAIYAKANSVTEDRGLSKHKGEGATVRQLETIFGVTRKTISKWADKFQ